MSVRTRFFIGSRARSALLLVVSLFVLPGCGTAYEWPDDQEAAPGAPVGPASGPDASDDSRESGGDAGDSPSADSSGESPDDALGMSDSVGTDGSTDSDASPGVDAAADASHDAPPLDGAADATTDVPHDAASDMESVPDAPTEAAHDAGSDGCAPLSCSNVACGVLKNACGDSLRCGPDPVADPTLDLSVCSGLFLPPHAYHCPSGAPGAPPAPNCFSAWTSSPQLAVWCCP
jgi:hypothetical protein